MRCLDLTGLWFATCNSPHIELGKEGMAKQRSDKHFIFHPCSNGWGHYASNACGVGAHGTWYGSSVKFVIRLAAIPESGFKSSTERQSCTVFLNIFIVWLIWIYVYDIYFGWWFCSFPTYLGHAIFVATQHGASTMSTASTKQSLKDDLPGSIVQTNLAGLVSFGILGGTSNGRVETPRVIHVDENICGTHFFNQKKHGLQTTLHFGSLFDDNFFGGVDLWNLESAIWFSFPKKHCILTFVQICVYISTLFLAGARFQGGNRKPSSVCVNQKRHCKVLRIPLPWQEGFRESLKSFHGKLFQDVGTMYSNQTWWDSNLSEVWTMFGKIL